MEYSLLNYTAERIGINPLKTYTGDNTLRVLQEYQFNCSSTNITSLVLGINIRRASNSRTLYPSVQVFRPNGTSNTYSLVTGSERTIYYSTSNVSTNTGGYQYSLNPPIPVMSGDLLAVSQPKVANSAVQIYSIDGIKFNSSQSISIESSTVNLNDSIGNQLILVYPVTGKTHTHCIIELYPLSLDGYCVNSTNSINASFIKEKALEVQGSQRIPHKRQFLYPEVNFKCNGSVVKWIFGGKHTNLGHIELQIWRQINPINYTKIGSSFFIANTMIGTNLYEFIPQTPLPFQEGDIFGIFQDGRFLYDQKYNGPGNLRINRTLNSSPQTIDREELQNIGNDFPLVTVEISNIY